MAKLANPNWPLVGFEADFTTTAGPPAVPAASASRSSLNAGYWHLVSRSFNIRRGRQYELDQVQAGECTINIPDPDEVLNPDNPASRLNTGGSTIAPYRPMWVWAMWPNQPGSGNILNPNVTPKVSGLTGNTVAFDGMVSGTGTYVATNTGQARSGTVSVLVTQTAAGQGFGVYSRKAIVTGPGLTYTISIWVYPTAGCAVTIAVVDAAGVTHTGSSTSTASSWQRIQVTWDAVDTQEKVIIYGTGTATPTFYIDDYQLEFGDTATPNVITGPTLFPLFVGYIERYPTTYDMAGTRAIRPLQAVDALALLSQTTIRQSYARTIAADGPQLVMALDDDAGPPVVAGNPSGTGYTTIPDGGQVGYGGDTLPDGVKAVSLSQEVRTFPSKSGTLSSISLAGALTLSLSVAFDVGSLIVIGKGTTSEEWATVTAVTGTAAPYATTVTRTAGAVVGLRLPHASGTTVARAPGQDTRISTRPTAAFPANFAGFTVEGWFRPVVGDISFLVAGENLTGAPPNMGNASFGGAQKRDSYVGVLSDYYGMHPGINDAFNPLYGSGGYFLNLSPTSERYAVYPDGQWHYVAITVSADPGSPGNYQWRYNVDEKSPFNVGATGTQALRTARFNELLTMASTGSATNAQTAVSVARMAFYPYALTDAQILKHAQRGFGYKGELSGARALRLLTQYWGGPVSVAAGFLALADDFSYDPTIITPTSTSSAGQARDVLAVLQEIQESERGLVYASKAGTVVVEDRESRYRKQTPLATLGEDPGDAGAEYPYSGFGSDFDPTYTFSQADLTSPYNGDFLPMQNPAAYVQVGQRVAQQQVQCVRDFDLEQAGIYYLTRYAAPRTRITQVVLKPSANPALWPLVLSLEISQRYAVRRRTRSGVVVSGDHYVEAIQHAVDGDKGEWTTTLQMSPVFVPQAWVLGDATYGVLGSTTAPIY